MDSLGGGLYNTLSLFNHSCDPCFMRANIRGKSVVCVTVKAIGKGQEITENYGLSYTHDSKERRQAILKEHYGFECRCVACTQDWPSKNIMKHEHQERMKKKKGEGRAEEEKDEVDGGRQEENDDCKMTTRRRRTSAAAVVSALMDVHKMSTTTTTAKATNGSTRRNSNSSSSSSRNAIVDLEKLLQGFEWPSKPTYPLYQVQNAVWEYLWLSRQGNKRMKAK